MNAERGSMGTNVLAILIGAVIAVLVYLLWQQNEPREISAHGTQTPQIQAKTNRPTVFSDGLNMVSTTTNHVPDETGAGITSISIFNYDINADGTPDKISRVHHEIGTAHAWDEYVVEINLNGVWHNITPRGFRTTVGAECALQKLQFVFEPEFQVIKISRPWVETWDTPSVATRTIYTLQENKFVANTPVQVGTVCDVTELFF